MSAPSLAERRSPWVVFTSDDDPWVTAETAALQKQGGLVFRLDGRELLEPASLFRTFARELSFLGYFGHNWDALVDCLHDWHGPGHGKRGIAILIDNADELLGVEFVGLLVSALCQAAWKANLQLDADGVPHENEPFALHFVLLLNHTPPAVFAKAATSDTDVDVTLEDGRLTATLTGEDWPDANPAIALPGSNHGLERRTGSVTRRPS